MLKKEKQFIVIGWLLVLLFVITLNPQKFIKNLFPITSIALFSIFLKPISKINNEKTREKFYFAWQYFGVFLLAFLVYAGLIK